MILYLSWFLVLVVIHNRVDIFTQCHEQAMTSFTKNSSTILPMGDVSLVSKELHLCAHTRCAVVHTWWSGPSTYYGQCMPMTRPRAGGQKASGHICQCQWHLWRLLPQTPNQRPSALRQAQLSLLPQQVLLCNGHCEEGCGLTRRGLTVRPSSNTTFVHITYAN